MPNRNDHARYAQTRAHEQRRRIAVEAAKLIAEEGLRDYRQAKLKAAQRLGFTLDQIAELIRVGRRNGRDVGLQVRAAERLAEVEARIADLQLIRENLRAALDAGCDDLHQCADSDCCPIPFGDLAGTKAVGS